MEPSPYNDPRTIWFESGERPHATTDYEVLLEREFDQLVERSIKHFPNLWNADEEEAVDEDTQGNSRQSYNYLSPKRNAERVVGHYCVVKPFPAHLHGFLRDTFERFGHVVETKVVKSNLDGGSLGIADFKEKEDAERAARSINGCDAGEGTILAARYMEKKKRSKTLGLIVERQSRLLTSERKKQPFMQPNLTGAEADLLTDLCQQWTCFSEMHGSMPLSTVIWEFSGNKALPPTKVHQPVMPDAQFDEGIKKTLADIEKELQQVEIEKEKKAKQLQSSTVRKLKW